MGASVDAISDASVVVDAVTYVHGGVPFVKGFRVSYHSVMYKLINYFCLSADAVKVIVKMIIFIIDFIGFAILAACRSCLR